MNKLLKFFKLLIITLLGINLNAQNCEPLIINRTFTENNDGFNTNWRVEIKDTCYVTYNCYIYDRYGNLVWENNDPINHWNGGFKTYSHFVRKEMYQFLIVIYKIDTVKLYTGSITILR